MFIVVDNGSEDESNDIKIRNLNIYQYYQTNLNTTNNFSLEKKTGLKKQVFFEFDSI